MMRLTRTRFVEDAFVGELEIRTDDRVGYVEVSGPEVPTVTIRRANGAEVDKFVPIGSRRPADLEMSVGELPVKVVPGPGKWTRGSYRIRVETGIGDYVFKPSSIATTQLVRDGTKLADFSMDDDEGDFIVYWIQTRDRIQSAGALGFWSMLVRGAEVLPD